MTKIERRTRIVRIVALATVLCAICALAIAVYSRGRGRVTFNTAQLVFAREEDGLSVIYLQFKSEFEASRRKGTFKRHCARIAVGR